MKKILLIFSIFLTYFNILSAQSDVTWMLSGSYSKDILEQDFGAIAIDFTKNGTSYPPFIANLPDTSDANGVFNGAPLSPSSTNISTSTGAVVLKYNGLYLNKVPYSDPLLFPLIDSLGITSLTVQNTLLNTGILQGSLLFPHKTLANHYVLLTQEISAPSKLAELYYSLINMSSNANHGQGEIIIKRKLVASGNWLSGGLMLYKHENGVDWWLVFREQGIPVKFHRFLIDEKGVKFQGVQATNFSSDFLNYKNNFHTGQIQSVYSPDGKYIVMLQGTYLEGEPLKVELFGFNRCKGEIITNTAKTFSIDQRFYRFSGAAFSPDSKLLYITSGNQLIQYNIQDDKTTTIANISPKDTTCSFTTCYLGDMKLAPDGRIYIHGFKQKSLSVIMQPNKDGAACQFAKDTLKLPLYLESLVFPNMPNYTNPLINCIIKANDPYLQEKFSISPNPGTDNLNISLLEEDAIEDTEISFFNALGAVIYKGKINNNATIDCRTWSSGLYTYRITNTQQQVLQAGKWVKM
jgi:hypothetical protein